MYSRVVFNTLKGEIFGQAPKGKSSGGCSVNNVIVRDIRASKSKGFGNLDSTECSISGSSAGISKSSSRLERIMTAKKYTDTTASWASKKSNSRAMSPYSWMSWAYNVSVAARAKKGWVCDRCWHSLASVALRIAGSSWRWAREGDKDGSMKSRIRRRER